MCTYSGHRRGAWHRYTGQRVGIHGGRWRCACKASRPVVALADRVPRGVAIALGFAYRVIAGPDGMDRSWQPPTAPGAGEDSLDCPAFSVLAVHGSCRATRARGVLRKSSTRPRSAACLHVLPSCHSRPAPIANDDLNDCHQLPPGEPRVVRHPCVAGATMHRLHSATCFTPLLQGRPAKEKYLAPIQRSYARHT